MEHQNMKKTSFTTQKLVFTALMTALVFVATYLPHIPIPLGYAHLGDAVIFLLWIVPTLVIKFVMAEIVYRIGRRGDAIVPRASIIAALLLSSLWMAAAYTLAGAVLYASMSAALASTPGLIMEGLVNGIIAFFLLPLLRGRFPQF